MIRTLLLKLTDRLPARAIMDNGEEYMIRFYLGTFMRRRMYIHLFLASDPDRGIHNHPWTKAWSFILSGWYFEERRGLTKDGGRRTVTVKWFNRLTPAIGLFYPPRGPCGRCSSIPWVTCKSGASLND